MTTSDDLRRTLATLAEQIDAYVAEHAEMTARKEATLETYRAQVAVLVVEVGTLEAELAACREQPTPDPTPEPDPEPPSLVQVGAFRGAQTRVAIDEHSAWQGRPNQWAVTFHGKGLTGPEKLGPVLAAHAGGGYRLNVRLALAGGWGTLEEVAAGKHDWRYEEAARALDAAGRGNSVISLGWEANMNGFPWKAQGREALYAMAFRYAVRRMREFVPDLEFSYDLLIGNTSADWRKAYPGDEWVDWIGLDAYDNSPISTTGAVRGATPADDEDRWDHLLTRPVGINEVFDFAAAHGKRKACFEWGCLTRFDKYANLSGGDNPYYIEQMFELARQRDVTLCYFEDDDNQTGALHRLMGATAFPKAAAAFREQVQR